MNNKYYVYALLDPNKPGKYQYDGCDYIFGYEPFYIGKGSGDRYKSHLKKYSYENESNHYKKEKIISIISNKSVPIAIKIKDNLLENIALESEIKIIKSIGKIIDGGILTNIKDGGDGPSGNTGGKITYKICENSYKVVDVYKSVYEAACINNLNPSDISRCCLGRSGYVKRGGYLWSFTKEVVRVDYRKSPVNMIDINTGEVIKTFDSATEGGLFIKKNKGNIISCCKGTKITSGGYLWEYSDVKLSKKFNDKRDKIINSCKILQIIDGKTIIHNSMKEAGEYNNISKTYVCVICKNISRSLKYNFEYFDLDKRKLYPKNNSHNKNTYKVRIIQHLDFVNIIHESVKSTANYNNISESTVVAICKGSHGSDRFNFDYYDLDIRNKYKENKDNLRKDKENRYLLIQLDLNGDFVKEWESISVACRSLKLKSTQHVSNCCNGVKKTAYGFKWWYKKDYIFNI